MQNPYCHCFDPNSTPVLNPPPGWIRVRATGGRPNDKPADMSRFPSWTTKIAITLLGQFYRDLNQPEQAKEQFELFKQLKPPGVPVN